MHPGEGDTQQAESRMTEARNLHTASFRSTAVEFAAYFPSHS